MQRINKNTILGGYGWGLAGTFTSFIILGNYGLAQQMKHGIDISGMIAKSGDYSAVILKIFDTLPLASLGLLLLVITDFSNKERSCNTPYHPIGPIINRPILWK